MFTGITVNYFLAVVFFSFLSHPLHLSVTNVEYSSNQGIWEVSVKLFKDDFGDEMKRLYGIDTDLDNAGSDVDSVAFRDYIRKNLEIIINGREIKVSDWEYEGKKVNFEAVWLNFSFEFNESPESVTISNTLMFSLFNDQKNLLIFTYKDEQKAFQFRHNKPKLRFDI